MFSEKLEEIIKASLVDGIITDKERQVIKHMAMQEGIDEDTVDVLLDARIQELRQEQQAKAPKVHKCPACGEILPALTGICPSCGNVVNLKDTHNMELDFLIEQMNRGIAQLKSCSTQAAPMVIATLEEQRRRAMTLYGENTKVKALLEEVQKEISEAKVKADRQQEEDEKLKRMEAEARIKALKNSGKKGGGWTKGCLISIGIFVLLGIIGSILSSGDEEKADKQYTELMQKLDDLKEDEISVENFEKKLYDYKELVWVTHNEYSDYEKRKKEAFEKAADNFVDKLSWFYATNKDAIEQHYGHPFFTDKE